MFTRARPNLNKYVAIAGTNLQNQLAYFWDFAWRSVFMVLIMFIFIQLWSATYKAQGVTRIAGLSLRDTIWYLVLAETVILGNIRFADKVAQEVRDGSIAYTLGRPYNYLLYHFAHGLGDALLRAALTFATGATLVWLILGPPPTRTTELPAILLVLVMAYILDFCVHGIIALSAFVIEDITAFQLIYQKITFILGGLLLPVDFLPDWLQRIANLLPFRLVAYAPGRLFVQFDTILFWGFLKGQLLWISLCGAILILMFRWGTRRVSINGG
jgi:ABC-2 type transport system permease protein